MTVNLDYPALKALENLETILKLRTSLELAKEMYAMHIISDKEHKEVLEEIDRRLDKIFTL